MLPRGQKGVYEHDDHGQAEEAPEKVQRARVGVHAELDGLRGGAEGLGKVHLGGGGLIWIWGVDGWNFEWDAVMRRRCTLGAR